MKFFPVISEHFGSDTFDFSEVFKRREGLRKVQEAGRVQILQDLSKSDFMAPSCETQQKSSGVLKFERMMK